VALADVKSAGWCSLIVGALMIGQWSFFLDGWLRHRAI